MKQFNLYKGALYLLLLLFAFSCSKSDGPSLPKGRTILVYVALDNNLSDEMPDVHASLMEGWEHIKADGTLLLFADSKGTNMPLLIKIDKENGEVFSDTLRTYDIENSASPQLLRQVIEDTKIVAPAKSYGMLLFSHASGWLPARAFLNPLKWEAEDDIGAKISSRSIFEDNGREMEFHDFVEAIPDGMFEFIASEMCFMSSVETAYALRNKAKYLLAAAPEVLSPGFEPIYKTSLDLLYKPKADLEGFGQAYFDYFNAQSGAYQSAAISLVRTSEMKSLAALTREIAPSLTSLIQDEIDQVQKYDGNQGRPAKGYPHLFFDFADYMMQRATAEQATELEKLLAKAVLFKRNTPKLINIIIAKHSGLSVYVPQETTPRLNKAYEETDWYKAVNN